MLQYRARLRIYDWSHVQVSEVAVSFGWEAMCICYEIILLSVVNNRLLLVEVGELMFLLVPNYIN